MSNLFCRCRMLVCLVLVLQVSVLFAQDKWTGVDRIVAIGDLHGDYEQFVLVMRDARLINAKGKWIGGKTHLVQTGDITDRGPDSARIIRDLKKIDKQARRKGGYVHVLIGNHEAMNMIGDLRYVHPGEYQALTNRSSKGRQEQFYLQFLAHLRSIQDESQLPVFDDEFRRSWEKKYPQGYLEHRSAWKPTGRFGKWVIRHNTLIRINDILFLHGGLSQKTLDYSITEMNDKVRGDLAQQPPAADAIIEDEDGPLWYRGLAQHDEAIERPLLEAVLVKHEARHIVMGHTVMPAVTTRFDGKAIFIDVGLGKYYGHRFSYLLVENGEFFAMHRGTKVPLPANQGQALAYYEKLASLEPDPSALLRIIQRLKESPTE